MYFNEIYGVLADFFKKLFHISSPKLNQIYHKLNL